MSPSNTTNSASYQAEINQLNNASLVLSLISLITSAIALLLFFTGCVFNKSLRHHVASPFAPKHDDAQLFILLVAMNVANLIFEVSNVLYTYPPSPLTESFCVWINVGPSITYGFCYMAVFLFLLKRAAITNRMGNTTVGRGAPLARQLAWGVAVVGSVVTMPIYFIVNTAGVGGYIDPQTNACAYVPLPNAVPATVFLLVMSVVMNATLLYFFVAPLYSGARTSAAHLSVSAASKFRSTARKGIVFAFATVGIQTVTMALNVASYQYPADGVDSMQVLLVQVFYVLLPVDTLVAIVCCMLMTNIWHVKGVLPYVFSSKSSPVMSDPAAAASRLRAKDVDATKRAASSRVASAGGLELASPGGVSSQL